MAITSHLLHSQIFPNKVRIRPCWLLVKSGPNKVRKVEEGPMPNSSMHRRRVTREQILDAAWGLAREQGLTGWTMRELADAVGLRAPSLYVHFASKYEIYDAMFADGYRTLLAQAEAIELPEDPRAAARTAAQTFVQFAVADEARLNLLFLRVIPGFEPTAASYTLAERVYAQGAEILARAGLTEPADIDLWTAVLSGLATQQVSNDPGGDRWINLVDRAVDLLLDDRRVSPVAEALEAAGNREAPGT